MAIPVVFLLLPALVLLPPLFFLLNSILSHRHRPVAPGPIGDPREVTIVIPVYREPLRVFEACFASARAQGSPVVVVGDGEEEPYRRRVLDGGVGWLRTEGHRGKKAALAVGLTAVTTPWVLFLDSDTTLPPGGVAALRARFTEGVGGVGANLTVRDTGHPVARGAEFVERSREVVLRAMSSRGAVMYLDGACVMYRTEAIRSYVASAEFQHLSVLGRSSRLGDDWLLTDHLLRSGYTTVKSYETHATTTPPSDWSGFVSQSVRWSRSGWIRLGRTLRGGLPEGLGRFYAFELMISYSLPLFALASGLGRLRELGRIAGAVPAHLGPFLVSLTGLGGLTASGPYFLRALLSVAAIAAEAIFAWTAVRRLAHRRLSTLAWGGVATAILLAASLYGLVTFWRAPAWRGAPTGVSGGTGSGRGLRPASGP